MAGCPQGGNLEAEASMQNEFDFVFHELFRRTYPQLLAYATGFVGSCDAEDVVEDVFADLWKQRNHIVVGDKIKSYLFRSVYTHALNVLKHRKITAGYLTAVDEINEQRMDFLDMSSENGERYMERRDLNERVNKAIMELPEKCRQVFRLSYLQGMSNKDISQALDLSVRTVETHMYRALRLLRERLKDMALFVIFFIFH
jgi:RNA polymerase sigma-70 factor (ECF subfamily)